MVDDDDDNDDDGSDGKGDARERERVGGGGGDTLPFLLSSTTNDNLNLIGNGRRGQRR